MVMKRIVLRIPALALIAALSGLQPHPAKAAGHQEKWCADAVDFAMRTAEYRGYGRSQEAAAHTLERDKKVFAEQYPDLSKADMQQIAETVYRQQWSHFGAAAAMSKFCKARAEAQPPAVLVTDHSDEWCANAVDFAMGAAQNRELNFDREMLAESFDQNPVYYHMQFPELSKQDLLVLTEAAYQRRWTRFHAAAAVSASCKVNRNIQPAYPIEPPHDFQG